MRIYSYGIINNYAPEKEKEEKQFVISAHPVIEPGPLVPKSDTLTTRPQIKSYGAIITIHVAQTTRVSAIFVFAYRVKTFIHC